MSYKRSREELKKYRKEVANFIKNYPIMHHDKEWRYYVLLTYKSTSRPSSGLNKRMVGLHKRLSVSNTYNFGIYVNEYGSYRSNPHHHLYLYNDLNISECIYRINSYWKHVGISKIDYFDPFRSIDYSTKHIGDSDFNDFHLFE